MKKKLTIFCLLVFTVMSTVGTALADHQNIVSNIKSGLAAFKEENYPSAIRFFNQALTEARQSNDPNVSMIHYNLALSYKNNKNYAKAEELYTQYLQVEGLELEDFASVWQSIGFNQKKQKKYDEAIISYKKSMAYYQKLDGSQSANIGDLYVSLFNVYQAQNDPKNAQAALSKAVAIISQHPDSGYYSQLNQLKKALTATRFYNDQTSTIQAAKKAPEQFDPSNPVDLYNQAKRAFENENVAQAKALLMKSINLSKPGDSHLLNVYNYMGFISFYNLQLDQAESNFKKVFEIAKSNYGSDLDITKAYPGTSLLLGKTYLFKGDFEQAKFYTYKAIDAFKEAGEGKQLEKAKKQLAEIKDANSEGSYTYKTGDVTRWSDETKEITVLINAGSTLDGWNPENINLAKQAFNEWSDKINHRLNFKFTDDTDNYDVKFSWVQKPFESRNGSNHVPVGLNKTGTWGNTLRYSDIEISLKNMEGHLFTSEGLYSTILHEIGHMIGLKEHSNNPADVMYPFTSGVGISERDVQTFNELYSKPPTYTNPAGVLLSQISKKIMLIDEGREYLNEGKHKKAHRYLSRIKKEFGEHTMIEELDYLLGVSAYGSGKYDEAIALLSPAKTNYKIKRYPDRYLGVCYVLLGHKYHDKWGKKNKKRAKEYYLEGVRILTEFLNDKAVDPLQKRGIAEYLKQGMAQRPPVRVPQYAPNGFYRYNPYDTRGFIQL